MKIDTVEAVRWLAELEPTAEDLTNRHITAAREWFPHQYVPWSLGRDFGGPLGGEPWRPEQSALSPAVRSALVVNLLTEDNLPGYHRTIAAQTSRDGAWGAWLHRWTAEEDRHAASIRAYLHATRAVDPVALERARMAQVGTGAVPQPVGVVELVAYVSVQELATRVSHRNTGRLSGDPVCERLLARVAQDENLHMVFYRELLRAALEIDSGPVLTVLDAAVRDFAMPGQGMPGFARMAAEVAVAGVYDLRVHHDEVLVPLLRSLKAFELTGLGPRRRAGPGPARRPPGPAGHPRRPVRRTPRPGPRRPRPRGRARPGGHPRHPWRRTRSRVSRTPERPTTGAA